MFNGIGIGKSQGHQGCMELTCLQIRVLNEFAETSCFVGCLRHELLYYCEQRGGRSLLGNFSLTRKTIRMTDYTAACQVQIGLYGSGQIHVSRRMKARVKCTHASAFFVSTQQTCQVHDYALDDFYHSPRSLGFGARNRSNTQWVYSHSFGDRNRCRVAPGHPRP